MLGKLFQKKKKNPDSKQYRFEMARQMANHHIRYVTEKRNGVDEVIGRSGGLNVRDDELLRVAPRLGAGRFMHRNLHHCRGLRRGGNPDGIAFHGDRNRRELFVKKL